jgi:hypothetical protein
LEIQKNIIYFNKVPTAIILKFLRWIGQGIVGHDTNKMILMSRIAVHYSGAF